MRWLIAGSLTLSLFTIFEKPVEGAIFNGFFRARFGFFGGGIFRRGFFGNLRRPPVRRISGVSRGGRNPLPPQDNHRRDNFNNRGPRRNQFDSVFDPGIGLTGQPLAVNGNVSLVDPFSQGVRDQFGRGPQFAKAEPPANPNDPCGIRFEPSRETGVALVSEGFYLDRRTNRCEYGFRGLGGNPFPFQSNQECELALQNGGCGVEPNQVVFRR